MNFEGEFRKIGNIDPGPIHERLLEIGDEIWGREVDRQKKFEVHKHTNSIRVVYDDGRNKDPKAMPIYREFRDVLKPILATIKGYYDSQLKYQRLRKKYGQGIFVRVLLAKLSAGGTIDLHQDTGKSLARCHRVHLPIVTNESVIFTVDNSYMHLPCGELWEINNRKNHGVANQSNQDRIHLIADYVLPGESVIDINGNELIC